MQCADPIPVLDRRESSYLSARPEGAHIERL